MPKLSFKRVAYNAGFIIEYGGSVGINTYCKSCDVDPKVIVQIQES